MKIYDVKGYNIPIIRAFDYCSHQINPDAYRSGLVIFSVSWHNSINIVNIVNSGKYDNCLILANTESEKEFFENKTTCDVIFSNHNAFLNENILKIINSDQKYDMVINSCFAEYKNVNLAKKINNTLHIGYYKSDWEPIYPSFGSFVNFKNDIIDKNNYFRLGLSDVVNYLNKGKVGGIFSKTEGACFASSEYLLCGLPVISVTSKGGREIWYNSDNSIICQDNDDSVKSAVDLAINNLNNGIFDREKIREKHIEQMDIHRNRLTEYLKDYIEDKTGQTVNYLKLKNKILYLY